ncbi:MAG: tetratricopeptide repeat protein [Flavobacteriales bacterium]|jgi:TolA-binding protein|nr:MAG: tetratricopeptide repeat protein [Flavobacteriales bacterium]
MNIISPALRRVPLGLAALLLATGSLAQRPAHYEHRGADLAHALELFDKAKYGAAQYEFERVVERVTDDHAPERVEAEYYSALCAVRLFHNDAGYRLHAFMQDHPDDLHVGTVKLELFKHTFAQKKWKESLSWSEKVDRFALSPSELEEYRFKRGYAFFQTGDPDKAIVEFTEVQNGTGPYAVPATYYASHIHYERGNHGTALAGFQKLQNDEGFGKVVPIYIAEILFLQGKYDELNTYVQPLLNDPQGVKRENEINRLAGEANYRSGNYQQALPYLEKSAKRAGLAREDRYILGYTYMMVEDRRKALEQFNLVANGNDSLAQLATYHMADCYLKLGEKNHARTAFKKAYDIAKDPKVTEDALFNYAKLAYDLSLDPYHEAINALKNYLKTYPNTPRRNEAYEFLLNVYLKTKNYEAALASLDEIKDKDLRLQEAYQKLAFDRGVELYEGRKYRDAALFFEKALKYPVQQGVNAKAHFWMAESYYGQGDYPAALRKYDDLRNSPGAYATELYEQAGYGMGYTYFKMKQYGEAATAFRRFVAAEKRATIQRTDAMVRVGDCCFVTKENAQAVKWYDDAVKAGTDDRDYTLYQKGVCQGLDRQFNEKIATLKNLLSAQPDSRYAADARFQLGETYVATDNDDAALGYYDQVIRQHPNSPHVRTSMLQVAEIQKRKGNTAQAIEQLKAAIAKYPTVDGSREALTALENIYVEQGRVAEYEAYVRTLSFVDPATLDLDEKYYRSAEALYLDGKCPQAIGAFGDYLNKYPKGAFALNARFYRGDCLYRDGKYDQAFPDLEATIHAGAAQFMESALYGASDILFREGRWEGALEHFTALEPIASFPQNRLAAQVGQMRCLKELGRSADAAKAAAKVTANSDASADLRSEAGIAVAKDLLDRNDLDGAFTKFKAVANGSTNALGAEAKYDMAYVRYLQNKFTETEKEVFDLVKKYPAYDHWKAKAFILLADAYVKLDDRFQAKAALQGVIDNSNDPDLVAQARDRLATINAEETRQTTPAPQQELLVPMPGTDNTDEE